MIVQFKTYCMLLKKWKTVFAHRLESVMMSLGIPELLVARDHYVMSSCHLIITDTRVYVLSS
jgi:hypothetical protein